MENLLKEKDRRGTYEKKHNIFGVIYKLTSPSNHHYIGQTNNFVARMNTYKSNKNFEQPKIYNAIKNHGWDNFKVEILCHCFDREDLNKRETHCIRIFNSYKNGYNCDEGGDCRNMSYETRIKLSKALTGKKRTPEMIEAMSLRGIGRKASEETKKKMSKALTGRNVSTETREKLRLAHSSEKTLMTNRKIAEKLRDKTIYSIVNVVTNEKFSGTRYEIEKSQRIKRVESYNLIWEKVKSSNNWILEKNFTPEYVNQIRKNIGHKYLLYNINTQEVIDFTKNDYKNILKCDYSKVKKLLSGEIKDVNGWILNDNVNEEFINFVKLNPSKRAANKSLIKYDFYDVLSNENVKLSISDFARSYNFCRKKVSTLVKEKIPNINSWILLKNKTNDFLEKLKTTKSKRLENNKIYLFKNIKTGERVNSTILNFCKNYNFHKETVTAMINNIDKISKDWTVIPTSYFD